MIISFFEEYPTSENLGKLNLITWPVKLYLAAPSIKEFKKLKSKINNRQIKEVIYWPVLSKKEGYWISPFSNRNALLRILNEVNKKKTPVMIDAELPTHQNKWLYLTQFFNFFRNRKLIRNLVSNNFQIYLAEYLPQGNSVMHFLGLHFPPSKYHCKTIKMLYHSMHPLPDLKKRLEQGVKEYGDNFIPAYGTIAIGEQGNEPILSPKQLKEDLLLAKQAGIKEVIIFRLGGLNKKYQKILDALK